MSRFVCLFVFVFVNFVFIINLPRADSNTMKQSYGIIVFTNTQSCKRVLQQPRHFVTDKQVLVLPLVDDFCS